MDTEQGKGDNMAHRVFFCPVEDNPVSALPILLELAHPTDLVVFLNQVSADENGSVSRLQRALLSFGFGQRSTARIHVQDWENGPSLQQAVRPILEAVRDNAHEIYVLVDGTSNRILPIVLMQLDTRPKLKLVRNDQQKVGYNLWDESYGFANNFHSYQRANTDLVTLLRVAGYRLFQEGLPQPVRIWPSNEMAGTGSQQPRYGYDLAYTLAYHEGLDDLHNKSHGQAIRVPDEALERWDRSWRQFLDGRKSAQVYLCLYHATKNAAGLEEELCTPEEGVERLQRASDALQELGEHCERRIAFAEVLKRLWKANATKPLGQEFEQAVAHRLLDWLKGKGSAYAHLVQSVWKNVRVCQESYPQTVVAEWDVAVVLRNGYLLCIECKCGSVESLKDWLARRETLRHINGPGASLIACTPLYTAFAHRSWFANQVRNLKYLRETVRIEAIPFTLPQQPRQVRFCLDQDNQVYDTWQEDYFEEHLERIFSARAVGRKV